MSGSWDKTIKVRVCVCVCKRERVRGGQEVGGRRGIGCEVGGGAMREEGREGGRQAGR